MTLLSFQVAVLAIITTNFPIAWWTQICPKIWYPKIHLTQPITVEF